MIEWNSVNYEKCYTKKFELAYMYILYISYIFIVYNTKHKHNILCVQWIYRHTSPCIFLKWAPIDYYRKAPLPGSCIKSMTSSLSLVLQYCQVHIVAQALLEVIHWIVPLLQGLSFGLCHPVHKLQSGNILDDTFISTITVLMIH